MVEIATPSSTPDIIPLSPIPPEYQEDVSIYEMFPEHFAKGPYRIPPPFWVELVGAGITTLLDPKCNTPSKHAYVLYAFLDFAQYDPAGKYAIERIGELLKEYQGDESKKESTSRYRLSILHDQLLNPNKDTDRMRRQEKHESLAKLADNLRSDEEVATNYPHTVTVFDRELIGATAGK